MNKPIQEWIEAVQNDGWNLTEWEENFIGSISRYFQEKGYLTPRQEEILERIYTEKVK